MDDLRAPKIFLIYNSISGTGKSTLSDVLKQILKERVAIVSSDEFKNNVPEICDVVLDEAQIRDLVIIDRMFTGRARRLYTIRRLRGQYPECRIICLETGESGSSFSRLLFSQFCFRYILKRKDHPGLGGYSPEKLAAVSREQSIRFDTLESIWREEGFEFVRVGEDSYILERLEKILSLIFSKSEIDSMLSGLDISKIIRLEIPEGEKLPVCVNVPWEGRYNDIRTLKKITMNFRREDLLRIFEGVDGIDWVKRSFPESDLGEFGLEDLARATSADIWDHYSYSFEWTHRLITCLMRYNTCSASDQHEREYTGKVLVTVPYLVWNYNCASFVVKSVIIGDDEIQTSIYHPVFINLLGGRKVEGGANWKELERAVSRALILSKLDQLDKRAFRHSGYIDGSTFTRADTGLSGSTAGFHCNIICPNSSSSFTAIISVIMD